MAYTRGRCTNIDYCTLADAKRDIEVRVGEDFVCPECARPLRPPPTTESSGSLNLAIAGGGIALLLIGGGIYAGYRLSAPSTPQPTRPSVQAMAPLPPAPAPVAAQPAQSASVAPPPPPLRQEQAVLLRLTGSTTLGNSLAPHLAAAYLAYLGDTGVSVQPGSTPGDMVVTGQRLSRPEAIGIITHAATADGNAAGFAALGRHDADITMSTRRITQQELDALRPLGDLTSADSEHAVGFEGQAIIVNPANPLAQLTLAQLRGVLSGTITTWPQLGGTGRNIHLLREPGDASLADIVPGAPPTSRAEHIVREAAAAVADDTDAMAIVALTRTGRGKTVAIASTGAQPAQPTPVNIATEAYPLARRLYLYTPATEGNPFVQRFAKFAISPEGQAAVAQAGLVPLKVTPVAPPTPLTPKDRYKQLVVGTKRLAADLHFEPNSNKLDLHSAREVDRVWNFMMSDHTPSDHLVLIGFADNQGTPDANLTISKQRAQAVAEVFAHRGLPPGQIVAFGSELPIADNATEEGRQKNRRVEVFLKP